MFTTITHTKIYGSKAAADVLKQSEINAAVSKEGSLGIKLAGDRVLVIVAEGDRLRFHIESVEPLTNTMFR